MEFIKVRNEHGQIKYLSVRNIIAFKEIQLESPLSREQFGENPTCLTIEMIGNGRFDAYGTGEEIGSLISILCEPSALQKSIETVIDKFLTPQERKEETIPFEIIPNGHITILEDLQDKQEEIINRFKEIEDRLKTIEAEKTAA